MKSWWLCLLLWASSSFVMGDPLWNSMCQEPPAAGLPFCDATLELEDRVQDYILRIPVEAQIEMMGNKAKGYETLGVPPYQWWSEGLHGPLEPCVSYNGTCKCATSFPCPSGTGNSFNTTLYRAIGSAIGKEGRAYSNLLPHDAKIGDGLTYWSPTINLQRDPRWGRNQEVPGEDPLNVGLYAQEFVQGLQGSGDKIQVAGCCKHFVANSLENWMGHTRHNFDAQVSQADLNNYYYPPFEKCIQAGVKGVMCSYNSLNGVPACHNQDLLVSTLREKWNFQGYVVTDCGALVDTIHGHDAVEDEVQASANAKKASVDVNCGHVFGKGLLQAYQAGFVEEADIVESFERLARIQFQLGLFDNKIEHPEHDISTVGSHGTLAREAAQQSIVLLQNKENLLPLSPTQKVVVIGPHAQATQAFLSNYHGSPCCCEDGKHCYNCIETPVEALQRRSQKHVDYVKGCHVVDEDLDDIDKAVTLAKEADVVVLMMGLDQSVEGEGLDRVETTLPGLQQQLIKAVLEVAPKSTVLVLVHGGAMSLGEELINRAPAIISTSYGGQAAADALASVLYGEYNPTGKLSTTMYPPSFVDELPLTEMGLAVGVGRTHMYYKGEPDFAFGHGLSYSKWVLEWVDTLEHEVLSINSSDKVLVRVQVTNAGPYTGAQTVLLLWRPLNEGGIRQKLAGFAGTQALDVGESQTLEFEIAVPTFAMWNEDTSTLRAETGFYELLVRSSDMELKLKVQLLSENFPPDGAAVKV